MSDSVNEMPSRTVRGWVVVNRNGHPFMDTIANRRRAAIDAYEAPGGPFDYESDRRQRGGSDGALLYHHGA
jgi:hypothetical protein